MSEEVPESKKTQLAYAIAQGKSVVAWARQNDVPTSTAYFWAGQPEVRRVVDSWRRRWLDRALGRMAGRAGAAVDGISKLAKGAESESVKLRAWRALLSDQIAVSKYTGWEGRLAELEDKMTSQSQGPNFQRGPLPVGTSAPSAQVPNAD
jgi:hypothetical protein